MKTNKKRTTALIHKRIVPQSFVNPPGIRRRSIAYTICEMQAALQGNDRDDGCGLRPTFRAIKGHGPPVANVPNA